ncbi:MAG TPA: hypothetical protein VK654_02785, partial [Nitrospirota bacterium]|nr:hypothetical protein [Nitrospirota bacterium]
METDQDLRNDPVDPGIPSEKAFPCSPKVIMSYFSQAEMSYCPPVKGGRDGERHYHDEHDGSKAAA